MPEPLDTGLAPHLVHYLSGKALVSGHPRRSDMDARGHREGRTLNFACPAANITRCCCWRARFFLPIPILYFPYLKPNEFKACALPEDSDVGIQNLVAAFKG